MQYNIWLEVCAIPLLLVLLFFYYRRYRAPFAKHRLFCAILWLGLLSTIFDAATLYMVPYTSTQILNIGETLFFLTRNSLLPVLLVYTYKLVDVQFRQKRVRALLGIPILITYTLLFSSLFTHKVFYFDEAGIYHRGPFLSILYFNAFFYFVAIVFVMIKYRKLILKSDLYSVISYLIITLICIAIQMIFPDALVECFGTAICMLIIQLTVQKPEEIFDGPSGFLNYKSFDNLVSLHSNDHKPLQIGIMIIENYDYIEKSFGVNVADKLIGELAEYLRSYPELRYYRVTRQVFCFVWKGYESRQSLEKWEQYFADIRKRFMKEWTIQGNTIFLCTLWGVFNCPDHANGTAEIMELIHTAECFQDENSASYHILKDTDLINLKRQMAVEQLVKEAVEKNMLTVVYQPIFDCAAQRFCSAEALVRMKDETLGNIRPDEFIPVSEKNGAILKIDDYVLETVCHFIEKNGLKELGVDYIEVNLSTVECQQENLMERILSCIERHHLHPSQINLEITETGFSELPKDIEEKMKKMVKAGITFSLDDYGTGYSNLSRLSDLPLHLLKVDKSLVQGMSSNKMQIILSSTFEMAKKLGKKILVEGVETDEQKNYVMKLGCDYIQGYYYAKPMSGDDFLELLQNSQGINGS